MKKICALLLTFILCISSAFTVMAEGTSTAGVVYEGGSNYSATKISHPDIETQQVDGWIDHNGQPDRGQSYSWAAVGYGDYIYVGTSFGANYQTLRILAAQNGLDFATLIVHRR
ncbi:MAG: hypothetical protein MSG78_00970 [Clostridiales bacterium]|nr:hypothetical protein [Clostridiales bacterium]